MVENRIEAYQRPDIFR